MLWDWQTIWQFKGALQLTAGVINLFDTKPPLSLNQGGAGKGQMLGYDERYFDARGRMLTLEARLTFRATSPACAMRRLCDVCVTYARRYR